MNPSFEGFFYIWGNLKKCVMKKSMLLIAVFLFISCKKEVKEEHIVAPVETPIVEVEKPISKEELKVLIKKQYAAMNEDLGGFHRPPNVSKEGLEGLLITAKNSIFEKQIQKSIDSLDIVMNKNILENESTERKDYETTLRNNFLDNNLNIRVKVSGKNNTKITLTYPLFDEVWFRKFQTEGHFDKLAKKGFKKIILSDNYDYNQWISYE
jgi:hypothetical protein